ncbi:MAG: extracellular solute-binding protein, partial [Desulfovibrio sp.]|nr:extracellular solute-binding protein [Desulfovibrio sp.]
VKIVAVAEGHDPVLYPVAVAKTGKNQADARKFVDFIAGPEGQAILKKFGFSGAR